MANTIHVDVVSAEESIYSGDAEFVVLPGVMGELGIFPKHTPLITQIKPGAVRIKVPGQAEEQIVFVQGGFLEVQPDVVTVLSDTAIRAHDLDEAKALRGQAGRRGSDAEQDVERGHRARRKRVGRAPWRSLRRSVTCARAASSGPAGQIIPGAPRPPSVVEELSA